MITEENKNANSGQYKPVLSQSTVKKRPTSENSVSGSRTTANRQSVSGSGSGSRTTTNRQSGSGSRATTNRQSGSGSRTTANRQSGSGNRTTTNRQSGNGNRTTANRQSGSGNRTTANRQSGSGNRTTANRQRNNNHNRRTTDMRQHPSGALNRRVRPRRPGVRITANQFVLMMAVVIGIIMVCIISNIMRSKYLKVEQLESEYVMGSTFDIGSFVEPVNDNARVYYSGTFEPEKIGTYKLKYTVRCGKLKKKNKITIEVVDKDFPDIQGPDELGFVVGEEANLGAYYTVVDSQPDLTDSLKADKVVDTSEVSTKDITLKVTDWCNNSSTKDIVVDVYNFEGDDACVAKAVREYNRATGYAVDDDGVYIYREDETQTACYILIDDTTVVDVDNDGICTVESSEDTSQDIISTIKENGKYTGISRFAAFNYNAN